MIVLHTDFTVKTSRYGGGIGALQRCWVRCFDCREPLSRVYFDHTEFSQGMARAEAASVGAESVEGNVHRFRCRACSFNLAPGEQADLFAGLNTNSGAVAPRRRE